MALTGLARLRCAAPALALLATSALAGQAARDADDPIAAAAAEVKPLVVEDDAGSREFKVERVAVMGCITEFVGGGQRLLVDWSNAERAGMSEGFVFVSAPPQQFALLADPERPGQIAKLTVLSRQIERRVELCRKQAPAAAPGPVFTPSSLPYPFSSAVRVGDILYLSGEIGADDSGRAVVPGGIEPETRQMFERIGKTLASHGLTFDHVFKCQVFLADMADWPKFNAIYAGYFKPGHYPARSAMGVNGLALGARVEMECWAWVG